MSEPYPSRYVEMRYVLRNSTPVLQYRTQLDWGWFDEWQDVKTEVNVTEAPVGVTNPFGPSAVAEAIKELARRELSSRGEVYPGPVLRTREDDAKLAQLAEIEKVVRKYFGLDEKADVSKAVITYPDQFCILVDMRHLLRALGGDYARLVERVEKEHAERKANELSYLSGAGVELGKES